MPPTHRLRRLASLPLLFLSFGGCGQGVLDPSSVGRTEPATFHQVALPDSISLKLYKGLTKPVSLPERAQCLERASVSTSREADYTIHFHAPCFGRLVEEFYFEFRVTPPHRGLKLDAGRFVVVERGPRIRVVVHSVEEEAAAAATKHAEMFLKLYKIERARFKALSEKLGSGS